MVKKPKKKPLVQVELGLGGLCGLTVICLGLFFWMYMFGVWTGQSALQSTEKAEGETELSDMAAKIWQGDSLTEGDAVKKSAEKKQTASAAVKEEKGADPSFFSIQVSAFKDKERAAKAVMQWRTRDYFSFYLLPEKPHGTFHRVFVGQFGELAEANILAAKLEDGEQEKVFITLVPENQKRYP